MQHEVVPLMQDAVACIVRDGRVGANKHRSANLAIPKGNTDVLHSSVCILTLWPYNSLVPITAINITKVASTETMVQAGKSLSDQTTAEPQSLDFEQAYSSNNEKRHDVSASPQHNDRKRKKKQEENGKADGEKQDGEEAGLGDFFVSLRLPIEFISS